MLLPETNVLAAAPLDLGIPTSLILTGAVLKLGKVYVYVFSSWCTCICLITD